MLKDILKKDSKNVQAFFNILGPVILNGINFFTIPIFTRMLGTTNYGKVSIYLTWVQVFTIILGLQTSGTLATSKYYLKKDETMKYNSSVLFLSFCSFIIVSIISIFLLGPLSKLIHLNKYIIILMLFNSFGAFVIAFCSTMFTFNKQAYKTFIVSIITSITGVILSLSLIPQLSEKHLGRILGYSIPSIIIGIFLFIYVLSQGKTFISKKYWLFCLPLCLPLIFHGLSHIILGQSDRVMLQYYTNDGIVGIYSLVYTFAQIISILWAALNNTWVPFYYEDIKNNNLEKINKNTHNYLFLFSIVTICFIYLSPEVIKIFASQDFWSGINLVPILSLGMYFMFLYSFPVNFQFFYKKTITIAIGTILAAITNIVLNVILIPRYSMLGAAIATLVSYIGLFIFHQCVSIYIIKKQYHYKTVLFIKYCLIVVGFIVLFYVIQDLWILRWAIGIALGLLLLRRIIKNKSLF